MTGSEGDVVGYERLDPIPLWYGCSGIALSALFFLLLNKLTLKLLSPRWLCKEDHWKWRNLFISWCHALTVTVWDLSCFYLYPELFSNVIDYHNKYIYMMVAFSTGYFFYDFFDIVINKQTTTMWEVIPHHIAVGGMFFYNMAMCRCISYNAVVLVAEVNTIFLHTRKLLQMYKVPFDHWLYRVNSMVNLFTFVACRFFGLAYIFYGIFVYYDQLPGLYITFLVPSTSVMIIINVVLFWRLFYSDVVRSFFPNKTSKSSVKSTKYESQNGDGHSGNGTITNGHTRKSTTTYTNQHGVDHSGNGVITNGTNFACNGAIKNGVCFTGNKEEANGINHQTSSNGKKFN